MAKHSAQETEPKEQVVKPKSANPKDAPKAKKTVPLVGAIVAAVVTCAAGLAVGTFVLGGGSAGMVAGKASLTEAELDQTVGKYTYNGTHAITAREALESSAGVEASQLSDGNYAMPSADAVLSYARNEILNAAVASEGIEVTDEDMQAYANDTLGSSDYAELASTYGMTEDNVKRVVRESAGVKKLYDKIVGTDGATEAPATPEVAEEGKEDEKNAEYGAYIVGLLGDEWDGEGNKWAREDGPFYAALKDMDFSADAASYNQAMQAYYVAYQQYSQVASSASATWSEYVNGLLAQASITIGELVS